MIQVFPEHFDQLCLFEGLYGTPKIIGRTLMVPVSHLPLKGDHPLARSGGTLIHPDLGPVVNGFLVFHDVSTSKRKMCDVIRDPESLEKLSDYYIVTDINVDAAGDGLKQYSFEGEFDPPEGAIEWWHVFARSFELHAEDVEINEAEREQWMAPWIRNKTVSELIAALQSFEDQELEVLLSVDGGQSTRPITFVENKRGRCLIQFALYSWLEDVSPETKLPKASMPKYLVCGKKIPQLIGELQGFLIDRSDRIVEISVDDGDNRYPISRIEQRDQRCVLMFCPD